MVTICDGKENESDSVRLNLIDGMMKSNINNREIKYVGHVRKGTHVRM